MVPFKPVGPQPDPGWAAWVQRPLLLLVCAALGVLPRPVLAGEQTIRCESRGLR